MERQKHEHPEGSVFYRREHFAHPVIHHGAGVYLYDTEGKRYLDGSGGAIVANLGHGVAEIGAAMAAQATAVAYIHPTVFTSPAIETYAARLAELAPLRDPRFYFLSSGSEAIEHAVKFARQAQIAAGQPSRYLTITRRGSYHGTTLGALTVTGKPAMRRPYQPLLGQSAMISPPYCYRCAFGRTDGDCGLECAEALEVEIKRLGKENVAAFLAEPIIGATLGAIVPPAGYWPMVRAICDHYGLLLIADEVMTGFGRTGHWFALERWGIRADVMTAGKGASGGYFPLSIAAVDRKWLDAVVDAGGFVHGGTFSHHPVAAAVGLATLDYLINHDLIAEGARLGGILGRKLAEALAGQACVGDVRGVGMLWGIEFVADRGTKQPFPPAATFRAACSRRRARSGSRRVPRQRLRRWSRRGPADAWTAPGHH